MTKYNLTISTSTRNNSTIVAPRQIQDGSTVWLVEGVRPSRPVTKSKHFKRADSEIITIRSPLNACDDVVIRRWVIKLPSILVPYSVFTVLTTRNNQVICGVPVTTKYYTIMSFPLSLFVSGKSWQDSQHLFRCIKNWIIFWTPAHSINSLVRIDDLGSQSTTSGPNFNLSIFSCSSKGGTLITPLNTNDGWRMCFCNIFFDSSGFGNKFKATVSTANCQNFLRTLNCREPIHSDYRCIDIHYFWFLLFEILLEISKKIKIQLESTYMVSENIPF